MGLFEAFLSFVPSFLLSLMVLVEDLTIFGSSDTSFLLRILLT